MFTRPRQTKVNHFSGKVSRQINLFDTFQLKQKRSAAMQLPRQAPCSCHGTSTRQPCHAPMPPQLRLPWWARTSHYGTRLQPPPNSKLYFGPCVQASNIGIVMASTRLPTCAAAVEVVKALSIVVLPCQATNADSSCHKCSPSNLHALRHQPTRQVPAHQHGSPAETRAPPCAHMHHRVTPQAHVASLRTAARCAASGPCYVTPRRSSVARGALATLCCARGRKRTSTLPQQQQQQGLGCSQLV